MADSLPVLAVTMGDPAGVGPEIIAKALAHGEVYAEGRPVVVGELRAMRAAVEITGVPLRVRALPATAFASVGASRLTGGAGGLAAGAPNPEPHPATAAPPVGGERLPAEAEAALADAGRDRSAIDVIDLANVDIARHGRGRVSAAVGRAAYEYVELAARLALAGAVGAVVTAPLNKEALSEAGWVGIGHTELLARFCGVPDRAVAMMLASRRLRVVHVSTHVPLRRAIELATTDRIVATARLAGDAARDIVGRPPRLAIAGLNPHAGEHGLFGTEEGEQIEPAIRALASEGWDVAGPLPPDTVFLRAANGEFDAVVAMYHDQGHIPSKFAGFHDTVNVTLGLPIVRTSVDHGTAYDIAGTGTANEENLLAALSLGARMARNRARASV